jgi:Ca2+/Na+ antiporter
MASAVQESFSLLAVGVSVLQGLVGFFVILALFLGPLRNLARGKPYCDENQNECDKSTLLFARMMYFVVILALLATLLSSRYFTSQVGQALDTAQKLLPVSA